MQYITSSEVNASKMSKMYVSIAIDISLTNSLTYSMILVIQWN